ncbi:MAG: mechanosensitive ion channel family protein [Planctomycetes bacterium]|nr:mechanosensitive ion channel family protein [Planctomycetota bacterium]
MLESLEVSEAALGMARVWAIRTLWAVVIMLVGWLMAGWLSSRTGRGLDRAHLEPTLARFLAGLVRWTVLVIAAVSALSALGVHTTSFAALIGAAGLAVALGFQGTLASFAAGVLLIVFRPFRVGDTIRVGAQQGRVDQIDLFTTALDTTDNRRVVVPNHLVFGQTIENLTFHGRRVVELTVPSPNAVDVEDARRALEEAARSLPEGLEEPAPEVQAIELQAAQVMFRVRVWVPTERLAPASDALVRAARRALDAAPKRG